MIRRILRKGHLWKYPTYVSNSLRIIFHKHWKSPTLETVKDKWAIVLQIVNEFINLQIMNNLSPNFLYRQKKTEVIVIKFIYSEKAAKFCENFTLFLTGTTLDKIKVEEFRKILWPSQNIWTLPSLLVSHLAFINEKNSQVQLDRLGISHKSFKSNWRTKVWDSG